MTIKAVVFDIGGVLEITPDTGWRETWKHRLGLDLQEIDERLIAMGLNGSLGTCTEAEWLDGLRTITGMNPAQIDAFMADLWAEYLGELNVELAAYFRSLRPQYQTAILSNSFLGARRKEQERYHFEELTDFIVYSHEVGLAKPDTRIYALTCERLGVPPEQTIFVDDVEPNIIAARAFGMQAVLFKETAQAIAEIRAYLDT